MIPAFAFPRGRLYHWTKCASAHPIPSAMQETIHPDRVEPHLDVGDRRTDAPGWLEGPPARWRVLVSPARSGAENMALDHAVAAHLRSGHGVLRVYRWSPPTVSFGRNEPSRGLYDREVAAREGLEFVRRPTGGRAVLHHEELTYAVAAPVRAWGGLRGAYRTINRGLVAALRRLGAPARLADPEGAPPPDPSAGPCFARAVTGEVVAGGRKLVGSAQARFGRVLLQHGSLPLSGSQDALSRIGAAATAGAGAPPGTLRSLLGSVPPRKALVDALVEGLSEVLGGRWRRGNPTPAERDGSVELADRYASDRWTWRR